MTSGQLFDVSVPVREGMPTWPGEPGPVLRRTSSIPDGDEVTVSSLACGVHTGTHLDAPAHFVEAGGTVDEAECSRLVGPAYVAVLEGVSAVDVPDLEAADLPGDLDRLLLRTDNSRLWSEEGGDFHEDYVYVTPGAARWMVERGLGLVGIDYLSVERYGAAGFPTHRTLLDAEVLILEGLDLTGVERGWYELLCLPLKLRGAEAASARALLRKR